MSRLVAALTLLALACSPATPRGGAVVQADTHHEMRTIDSVNPKPAVFDPPPMLTDEAPPPKPKRMPWETEPPEQLTADDERVRSSLPFAPAIAMDPIDGSKISIRATTPTVEYKGHIYYFQSEENRRTFQATPDQYVKGGFMKL